MLISVEGTGKCQVEPGQESMEDSPVLSHCTWLKNPWPKPTGVLEHCRERGTNFRFFILGVSSLTASLRRRRIAMIFLFDNFRESSLLQKFLQITLANSGELLKLLRLSYRPLLFRLQLRLVWRKSWSCPPKHIFNFFLFFNTKCETSAELSWNSVLIILETDSN